MSDMSSQFSFIGMMNVNESSGARLKDSDSMPIVSSLMSLTSFVKLIVLISIDDFEIDADKCWWIDIEASELKLFNGASSSLRFSQLLTSFGFLAQVVGCCGASIHVKVAPGKI